MVLRTSVSMICHRNKKKKALTLTIIAHFSKSVPSKTEKAGGSQGRNQGCSDKAPDVLSLGNLSVFVKF